MYMYTNRAALGNPSVASLTSRRRSDASQMDLGNLIARRTSRSTILCRQGSARKRNVAIDTTLRVAKALASSAISWRYLPVLHICVPIQHTRATHGRALVGSRQCSCTLFAAYPDCAVFGASCSAPHRPRSMRCRHCRHEALTARAMWHQNNVMRRRAANSPIYKGADGTYRSAEQTTDTPSIEITENCAAVLVLRVLQVRRRKYFSFTLC